MAAKQGLSAQISQASEDAKRAVLNRTSLTTSLWFSNLNTTCTIKSAPPRTPEVLSLLSTKSGWLFKRNEQHVWQTRWCCVVPHTFLYYFDANVLPGEAQPPVPSPTQQEDWNQAVANGYPHRGNKKSAPRSSLYFLPSAGGGNTHHDSNDHHHDSSCTSPAQNSSAIPNPPQGSAIPPTSSESFASMQPAGIIDLECYTSVHRSAQNQLVLELAGDDAVNPDLRQFYFSAGSEQETEAWTQALLGQRHTALMDETDAYKQVCDGFAQQLQVLHVEMDRAQKQAEDAQEELYHVRSETEEGRRSCWKMVEEVLDRQHQQQQAFGENNAPPTASQSFRAELDAIRSQDISLLAPVQLLSDYTRVLEDSCTELQTQNKRLQETLAKDRDSDHDQVRQLQQELEDTKAELERQTNQWGHEKQVLQQKVDASTKELEDLNKDLASTRMEVTMYQSSTRNKITELQNHKKILKKEVIDLRQKLDDARNELSLVRHKEKSHLLEVEQERNKAALLERYVDKMESQVKVQQNMMELMSAGGSVHGGPHGSGSHFEVTVPHTVHSPTSYHESRNVLLMNTPSDVGKEKHVINIHDDAASAGIQMPSMGGGGPSKIDTNGNVENGLHHYPMASSPLLRRGGVDDSDNKSHMSELTEDRTQKQFDALQYLRETRELREREMEDGRPALSNARILRYSSQSPSPQSRGPTPPTFILGGNGGGDATSANNNTNNNANSSSRYTNSMQQQHQQQLLQNFQNPESAKLETIHSSATAVTTPNRILPPDNLPRSSRTVQQLPHQVMVEHSSSRSLGAGTPGRLSVAQRARLQADRGSTPIKIRLDSDSTKQFLEQQQQRQKQQQQQEAPPQQEQPPSSNTQVAAAAPTSPTRTGNRPDRRPSTSSRSAVGAGGFFSNIGRKLEAAIDKSVFSVDVHVRSDDESDSDVSSSASSQGGGGHHDLIEQERDNASGDERYERKPTAATAAVLTNEALDGQVRRAMSPSSPKSPRRDFAAASTPNGSGHLSPHRSTPGSGGHLSPRRSMSSTGHLSPRRNNNGYSGFSDEKKTPTPDRIVKRSMSLKERQQLQRAKQLEFLKNQGLIKDEADVKGGAGAASPSFDAGSVTSTHISSGPADSSVSFPASSPSRSLSSRLLRS